MQLPWLLKSVKFKKLIDFFFSKIVQCSCLNAKSTLHKHQNVIPSGSDRVKKKTCFIKLRNCPNHSRIVVNLTSFIYLFYFFIECGSCVELDVQLQTPLTTLFFFFFFFSHHLLLFLHQWCRNNKSCCWC